MATLKQTRAREQLRKKAKRGHRGFPLMTIVYYGETNKKATKVAVGLVLNEEQGPEKMERWRSMADEDLRQCPVTAERIMSLHKLWGAQSIGLLENILGCPHEEGIDYPEGEDCPQCPYWANRDRFTGETTH